MTEPVSGKESDKREGMTKTRFVPENDGEDAFPEAPAERKVYVFFDPFCPYSVLMQNGNFGPGLLKSGVKSVWIPVSLLEGSLPHGEFFLSRGRLAKNKDEVTFESHFYSWAKTKAPQGKNGNGKGPKRSSPEENWAGPSMVLENSHRFRELFKGGALVSPVTVFKADGRIRVLKGVPKDYEIDASKIEPLLSENIRLQDLRTVSP
jgi:hypothetical protein